MWAHKTGSSSYTMVRSGSYDERIRYASSKKRTSCLFLSTTLSYSSNKHFRLSLLLVTNSVSIKERLNPFSATTHYKPHPNKVKVKGLGRKSSCWDGFWTYFNFYRKISSVIWLKQKCFQTSLCSIKTFFTIAIHKNGIFILKLISIYLPEWFIYSTNSPRAK